MLDTNAASERKVEGQTIDRANSVNGLENGSDSESIATHAPESVFVKRRRRRRLDLRTLAGTLRESARVYRDIAEGRISLAEGEVRSRVLGRHRDILAAIEQSQQLKDLNAKIDALRGDRPDVEYLPGAADEVNE